MKMKNTTNRKTPPKKINLNVTRNANTGRFVVTKKGDKNARVLAATVGGAIIGNIFLPGLGGAIVGACAFAYSTKGNGTNDF